MSGSWWTRAMITLLAFLWSIWTLVPSFLDQSAMDRFNDQAAQAEAAASGQDAAAAEVPWWFPYMSKARITFGLDLQGGIDLTLNVDVDEALASSVQRDIKPILDTAEKEGVRLAEVTRARGEPTLLILPGEGTTLVGIQDLLKKQYSGYEYVETRSLDGKDRFAFTVTSEQAAIVKKRAVEQARETLMNRIDETGVKEPSIVLRGESQINVQLPGIDNIEQATQAIGQAAVLEFMLVDEDVMRGANIGRIVQSAKDKAPPEAAADDDLLTEWLVGQGLIPATDRVLFEYVEQVVDGKKIKVRDWEQGVYVVKSDVILTGDDINNAQVGWNQYNEPYVSLDFKPRGSQVFCDVTTENVRRRFAIVLDGQVRSAPNIREKICGGRASIEMGTQDAQASMKEAQVLSLVLRTGALPAPVQIGQIQVVGASLGADAVRSGVLAAAFGSAIVVFYMIFYYRLSGVLSVVALTLNVLMNMALLAMAGATLTLPGFCGIALTVAMAVDCNIIIYERIREEMRIGKNSRAAADTGFDRALWAILDGHITMFISGVVLYTYGSGPIKGFAVTLMIGIVTTLFTGVMSSRVLMEWVTRRSTGRLSI